MLLDGYQLMEKNLEISKTTVAIGPQREGALLLTHLGWNKRAGAEVYPHAKRIPYNNGIVVGLEHFSINKNIEDAVIVDGAIASASTLMSFMLELKAQNINYVKVFNIN